MLSLIVFLPLLVAALLLFVPGRYVHLWRSAAVGLSVLELVFTGWVYYKFSQNTYSDLESSHPWLYLNFGSFGWLKVDFHLKTDGLNLALIMLSGLIFFVSSLASFDVKKFTKGYYLLFFLLMSAVLGCFLAHDFLLFFLFFEFMLLPMYFLVGIWGGERREYAAIKFFLYTLLGSVFILLVLIATYSSVFHPTETLKLAGATASTNIKDVIHLGLLKSSSVVHTLDFDFIFNPNNYIQASLLDANFYQSYIWGWDTRKLLFFLFL
ncbi:MAG TPA: oxidoreductase, partial [Cytophagales bacterium]|nr:oxidoreductase [Cytophagales bacterium]